MNTFWRVSLLKNSLNTIGSVASKLAMLGRLSDPFSSVLSDYLFSRSVGNLS